MPLNKVTAESIADGTVVASDIADGTITLAKLQSGLLPSAIANSAASYANGAFASANTSAAAGSYANSAFAAANTATASGSYANSAFAAANTASTNATNAGTYANSAFASANTATASGSYANSAFSTANTSSTNATNAGTYANSAFAKANTAGTGTVTSVATGNGLSGGTITTTGTLTVACPTFNSVGSYCFAGVYSSVNNFSPTAGSNYSAGSGNQQVQSCSIKFAYSCGNPYVVTLASGVSNNLSGTWKMMGASFGGSFTVDGNQLGVAIFCRVS